MTRKEKHTVIATALATAKADNAKLRAEVEQQQRHIETEARVLLRVQTAEAREAALVACLRELRDAAETGWHLSTYAATINWDEGDNTIEWLTGLRMRIEKMQELWKVTLLAAQPRQEEPGECTTSRKPGDPWGLENGPEPEAAPDPSLALIRELRDAARKLLRYAGQPVTFAGKYHEARQITISAIARSTGYLREHGADSPEADEEGV